MIRKREKQDTGTKLGGDGTRLKSQHSKGKGRQTSVSPKIAWSAEQVPGQSELHREIPSQRTKTKKEPESKRSIHLFCPEKQT